MNHETKVPDVGTDDVAGLGKALQVVRCDQDRQFLAFLLTVARRQAQPNQPTNPSTNGSDNP